MLEKMKTYEVEYDVEDNWISCPFRRDNGDCEIIEFECFDLSYRSIPDNCPAQKGVIVKFKEKPCQTKLLKL